ncbi:sortase B [Aequitasia blattaphilus]|uniref:Class B sortase n=1 Tax=Aequitasia blattaphilus TaxID=2949332 RepID=A0ABT1E9A8_9FIRM|nr:class B sortase [Aequitasia blattaphilus]MCP1102424.1 class B sortase [Aequitasia blattaphilus]MCR8615064.1 class B sortase [Aequitasia blattaphilus]
MKMNIRIAGVCILLGIIGYSTYRLLASNQVYQEEQKTHQELLTYKPEPEEQTKAIINQSLLDLQKKNPDVAGWITIPGTGVDYPFLWANDYQTYLRTDINKEPSISGAIFLDYRFDRELAGFKGILFGHSMDNGSMFGSLANYQEREFFQGHQEGTIHLPYENLKLSLVAAMVVQWDDAEVYGVADTKEKKEAFLETLRERNIHGRERVPQDLTQEDRFILLSTCSYVQEEERTVVVFRIQ